MLVSLGSKIMSFNLHDLKFVMYLAFGLLGLCLLGLTAYFDFAANADPDPISYQISALITLVVGAGAVFFCVETFLLRGEDDIWQ